MTAAYFEDHPTDPDKVILRKPKHEDYVRPWVGLTVDELIDIEQKYVSHESLSRAIERALKEKNT